MLWFLNKDKKLWFVSGLVGLVLWRLVRFSEVLFLQLHHDLGGLRGSGSQERLGARGVYHAARSQPTFRPKASLKNCLHFGEGALFGVG